MDPTPMTPSRTTLVLGASGRTGRRVVAQALADGGAVRALSRRATSALVPAPGLTLHDIDLLATDDLEAALDGCDAVVSTLGVGTSREETILYSSAVEAVLGVRPEARSAAVSAAPIGGCEGHAPLERRVAIPLLSQLSAAT